MNYSIKTIPHSKQHYPTVGWWGYDKKGNFQIEVSDMKNVNYEFLVAAHEMIEAYLCRTRGITQAAVDKFDMAFEKKRKPGDMSEPGNDKKAPYFNEHKFATEIEGMIAEELGIDWLEYNDAVNEL